MADFLKGLIKLAAAGVKLREGRPAGVKQHATRCVELLQHAANAQDTTFGLQLTDICNFATELASNPSKSTEADSPNAARTLDFTLQLNKP